MIKVHFLSLFKAQRMKEIVATHCHKNVSEMVKIQGELLKT